jgi:hypothetical protein
MTGMAARIDYGVRRVIMRPDAILAAWRAWLIWCQINQTHSILLMWFELMAVRY